MYRSCLGCSRLWTTIHHADCICTWKHTTSCILAAVNMMKHINMMYRSLLHPRQQGYDTSCWLYLYMKTLHLCVYWLLPIWCVLFASWCTWLYPHEVIHIKLKYILLWATIHHVDCSIQLLYIPIWCIVGSVVCCIQGYDTSCWLYLYMKTHEIMYIACCQYDETHHIDSK